MPTAEDERRAKHVYARLCVLEENWDDIAGDWIEDSVGAQRAQAWGIPDISVNTHADICRQLSTPGLYGVRPQVRHTDPASAPVFDHLTRVRYWTRMQRVQYLTLGLGDFLLRFGWDSHRETLKVRHVSPHDVYVRGHPDEPDRIIELWELRRRRWDKQGRWVYVWDQYDISDPKNPSFRIFEANNDGTAGEELSHIWMPDGTIEGEAWEWWSETGEAVLPWVRYRAAESGSTWNHMDKRGAYRGALNAAKFWTYAAHCARDATGSAVILSGMQPPPSDVVQDSHGSGNLVSFALEPGMVYMLPPTGEGQPFAEVIGPGMNLGEVARFAEVYEMKQLSRWGLNADDVSKTSASPVSGAALAISNRGRREFSAQVEEVFRASDLDAIRLTAIILRRQGIDVPETGYSISYHRIPESPQERDDRRRQTDWEVERGFASPVSAYIEWNPGTTREAAIDALVASKLDAATIERRVQDQLREAGLTADQSAAEVTAGRSPEAIALIVGQVARREIPRDSGLQILVTGFKMTPDEAEATLAEAGTTFTPPTEE